MRTNANIPQSYAPCAVWFNSHESVFWNFNDKNEQWQKVPRVNDWAGNTLSYARGKYVCHVFREPGLYNVKAEDDVGVVSMYQIEVREWDGETWGVANDGDFLGKKFDKTYTDYNQALEDYKTCGVKTRILLKRGDTYYHNIKADIRRWGSRDQFHLGAYGGGNKPIVNARDADETLFLRGSCNSIIIQDIDFIGSWDTTTETGEVKSVFTFTQPGNVVLHNCSFDGLGLVANIRQEEITFAMSGCKISNWKDYGILAGEVGDFALIGNIIEQTPEALPGGPKGTPHNHHGPVRISLPKGKTYIGYNQMFSNNGWSGAGGAQAHQACFRWNVSGWKGAKLTCENNVMEGGWSVIDSFANTSSAENTSTDAEFSGNLIIGTANTYTGIRMGHSGVTISENTFVFPDVPAETNKSVEYAIEWDKSKTADKTVPNKVYENDVVGAPNVLEKVFAEFDNNFVITPKGDPLFEPLYKTSPKDFIKVEAAAEDEYVPTEKEEKILALLNQIGKIIMEKD